MPLRQSIINHSSQSQTVRVEFAALFEMRTITNPFSDWIAGTWVP